MAENFTDIEMKPLEQPVLAKRQSVVRQHVQHTSIKVSETRTTETKGDNEGKKLKAPFTWHLLEEFKYSSYIKRFFRFIALVNVLSLAVNGPATPAEYLRDISSTCNLACENPDEKMTHFIILLAVDVILSLLYTVLLFIRVQNSLYWHKLKRLKV